MSCCGYTNRVFFAKCVFANAYFCPARADLKMFSIRRINIRFANIHYVFYSKLHKQVEYKKCYEILGVSEDSDQEQIRRAYLQLVKQYHPDNPDGDLKKFQEIDKAFRTLIQKKSRERWDVEDTYEMKPEEYDIKHTAPQHRQYLSYGGAGSGTPFQREKQYVKMRAMQAANNVLEHRIAKLTADEKTLMDKNVPTKHKIKTKYGFDRLVEDLIQESMSKGEFNNLSGCGKPLKNHQDLNPYVDFVTHKLNQVLIDNGFTPEWITLQKEIREEIQLLREDLAHVRCYYGPFPLNEGDSREWEEALGKFRDSVVNINKKINKFNLVVPILNKQMLLVDLEREAENVVRNGKCNLDAGVKRVKENVECRKDEGDGGIWELFGSIFKK